MTNSTKQSDLVDTHKLHRWLGLHPLTIPKLYGEAFVRRRLARDSSKMYAVSRVVAIVSEQSGFTVTRRHLRELITQSQGMELMAELGKPRCYSTWGYWRQQAIGPRPVWLGGALRYIRSDVIQWADDMPYNSKTDSKPSGLKRTNTKRPRVWLPGARRSREQWRNRYGVKRKAQPQVQHELASIVGDPEPQGNEGVGHLSYIPESGAV